MSIKEWLLFQMLDLIFRAEEEEELEQEEIILPQS